MQNFYSLLVCVSIWHLSVGQKPRNESNLQSLVSIIDASKTLHVYQDSIINTCSDLNQAHATLRFTYFYDSNSLRKAVLIDSASVKTFYFTGEQLIEVKERVGATEAATTKKYYFTDADFSLGTTYKDFSDPMILERQQLLAEAYKILYHYRTVVK